MGNEGIIRDLIEKPLAQININVDDVIFTKEGSMNILRITIDKEPYVDVDDCVSATKIINPLIDGVSIVDDTYILDVCSKEKGGDK